MKTVTPGHTYVYLIRNEKYHLGVDLDILSAGICQLVWHGRVSDVIFADMKGTI